MRPDVFMPLELKPHRQAIFQYPFGKPFWFYTSKNRGEVNNITIDPFLINYLH
jgi:hypothetical protein